MDLQLSEEDKDKSENEEHFNISLVTEALDLATSCISLLRQIANVFEKLHKDESKYPKK